MEAKSMSYVTVKLKKNTVDVIQKFFNSRTTEDALDKVVAWLKDKKDENNLLKKYEGKMNVKKVFQ